MVVILSALTTEYATPLIRELIDIGYTISKWGGNYPIVHGTGLTGYINFQIKGSFKKKRRKIICY